MSANRVFSIAVAALFGCIMLIAPFKAWAQTGVLFVEGDKVGIGVEVPQAPLHVQADDGTAEIFVEETNPTSALRTLFRMQNSGALNTTYQTPGATWRQQFQDNAYTLTKDGTGGNEVTIIASTGDMYVRGRIFSAGPTCVGGCDALFEPGRALANIDDHAAQMWSRGFLPAVGATEPHRQINVTEMMGGILNELEMAHIYIEQLHRRLEAQERQIAEQEDKEAEVERLEARLDRLEAVLERVP